jgi:hypothetical protein
MTTINATAKSPDEGIAIQHRRLSTFIWVTFDKVGFHRYPDAPEEVAYLRDVHRHVFKFKVRISVFHNDREIEFHMFKNWLTSLYEGGDLNVDFKSCEMLATDLLCKVLDKYDCSARMVLVDVSEDGECGATLESHPSGQVNISKQFIKEHAARLEAEARAGEVISEGKEFR